LSFESESLERGPCRNQVDRERHLRPRGPAGQDAYHKDPQPEQSAEHGLSLSHAEELEKRAQK
jgi:hypothetical protein